MSHVIKCERCFGVGFRPTDEPQLKRYHGQWYQLSSVPCEACICFDCGTHAGEYEVCIREGHPQPVCLECAVMSGDDNFNSYQERNHGR